MSRIWRFYVPLAGVFGIWVAMPRHNPPTEVSLHPVPWLSKIRQSPIQVQELSPLVQNNEVHGVPLQKTPLSPSDEPFSESFEHKFVVASANNEESIQPGIESHMKEALGENSQMDSMLCFGSFCKISFLHADISEADAFTNRALADQDESKWLRSAFTRTLEVNSDGSLLQVIFLELVAEQR